jgi:hypothetical protein
VNVPSPSLHGGGGDGGVRCGGATAETTMNRARSFDLGTNKVLTHFRKNTLPISLAYRVLRSAMTRSLPVTG